MVQVAGARIKVNKLKTSPQIAAVKIKTCMHGQMEEASSRKNGSWQSHHQIIKSAFSVNASYPDANCMAQLERKFHGNLSTGQAFASTLSV
jgi:hypothetical protein